ncbi:MAG: class I SAM-dependent methyltransferase [Chloroflexota bacterium]
MVESISSEVWSALRCVECGHRLHRRGGGATCVSCGASYPYTEHGSLDLRLTKPKAYPVEFRLGEAPLSEHSFRSEPLKRNPSPEVDFSGVAVPRHLTGELLSFFPQAGSSGSLMLDLGCGEAVHKEVCAHAGFEWVGIDHNARRAPILADAHSIPFEAATFEFVLCVTVLQYVRFPFVVMREAYRVLEPQGVLIGTVAFLEPSHGTSFYHPSHVGLYNLLQDAGFRVQHIAPFVDWPALKALASMGLFHGMPRELAQAVVVPLQLFHKLWWRLGGLLTDADLENDRINHFAGSFSFIASK